MSWGERMVTFFCCSPEPATRNCVQLMLEIQATMSAMSVSGLKLNFTMRLPGGSFRHWLNSRSPGSSTTPSAFGGGGATTTGPDDSSDERPPFARDGDEAPGRGA